MAVARMSSKGQIVIPSQVRRQVGLSAGDVVMIEADESGRELRLRKVETIDEMADRFTAFLAPGTSPLLDATAHYRTRAPRV